MNYESLERLQEIASIYTKGTEEVKETILSLLSEDDKKVFLEYISFQKLFTDKSFYNAVKDTIGQQIYNEFNS